MYKFIYIYIDIKVTLYVFLSLSLYIYGYIYRLIDNKGVKNIVRQIGSTTTTIINPQSQVISGQLHKLI